ncbi:Protein of unknown function [Pyronema omphalodes CBS 100304]|uniref:Uncharacterized protein n=1 Tax=Pyronema omphalodes (strain CBS 100304) TaxID=1076935 RepID=U4L6T3_PYROM|nr:Protein of unknown function [Pyronema omphalodes CBS 100304]
MKPQTTDVAEEIDSGRLEKSHNIHTSSPSENKDHNGSSRTNGINDNGKVDHAVNGRGSVEINNTSDTPLKGQGCQNSKSYWKPISSPRPTDPWSKKVAATGDRNRTGSPSPKGEEKMKTTENQNTEELFHTPSWEQAQPAWKKAFPTMIEHAGMNSTNDGEMTSDKQITIHTTFTPSMENKNGNLCTAYRSTVHHVTNVLEPIEKPKITKIDSSYEIIVIPVDMSSLSPEQDNPKRPQQKTRYRAPPRRNVAGRTPEHSRAPSIADFSSTESTSNDEPRRLYTRRGRRGNKTIGMVVEPAAMRENRNKNVSGGTTSVKTEDKGVQVGGGEEKPSMVYGPEVPSQPIPAVITHLPSPSRSDDCTTDKSPPRQPTTPEAASPKKLSINTCSSEVKNLRQNVRQLPQSPRSPRTPPHLLHSSTALSQRTARRMNSFSSDNSHSPSPTKTDDERLADGIARSQQVLKDLFKTQNEALSRRYLEERKKAARESAEVKKIGAYNIKDVKIEDSMKSLGKKEVDLNDTEVAVNDTRPDDVADEPIASVHPEVIAGSAHGAFSRAHRDAFGSPTTSTKDDLPAQHANDTSLGHSDAAQFPSPVENDSCLAPITIRTRNAIATDCIETCSTDNSNDIIASPESDIEIKYQQNINTDESPTESSFQRAVVENVPSESPAQNIGDDDAGNTVRCVSKEVEKGDWIAATIQEVPDGGASPATALEEIGENNVPIDAPMQDQNENNRQGANVTEDQSSVEDVITDRSQEGDQRFKDVNAAVRRDFKRYDPLTEEFRPRKIDRIATISEEIDDSDDLSDQEDHSSRINEFKPLDLGIFEIPVPLHNAWLRDPTQCMLRFGSAIGIPPEQRVLHKHDEITGEIVSSTEIDVHG